MKICKFIIFFNFIIFPITYNKKGKKQNAFSNMKNGKKSWNSLYYYNDLKPLKLKQTFGVFFFFKNIHFVQIYVFLEFLNMLSPFNVKSGIFWKMSFLEKIIFGKNHDFFQWFISDIYRIFINDIYQLINIMPTLVSNNTHLLRQQIVNHNATLYF